MTEPDTKKIYKGDTGPIKNVYPEALDGAAMDSNWTCKIAVNDPGGNAIVAARAVTTKTGDNTKFVAYLTPSETAQLAVTGDYTDYEEVIQLTNSTITPSFNREYKTILRVIEDGIS